MTALDLVLLALATFYVAHAVSSMHGPFGAFETLRTRLPLGGLTGCMVCLSFWSGAFFYLMLLLNAVWLVWIAAAAGASVLLYRYTGGAHV